MKALLQLTLIILTAYTLQSCFGGGNIATAEEETEDLRGTQWVLDEKRDFSPNLSFDKDLRFVSGNTGCNSYNADFILKNYSFEIKSFVTTEMFCEDLQEEEQDFYLRLSESSEFRIMNDKVLILKNRTGRILLKFRKK